MNRGQIKTLMASFAEDQGQSRYAGLYDSTLDRAQEQFALDSKALFKDQSITVVGGTAAYALNSDFMWEKKVTYKGVKLNAISRDVLERVKVNDDWTDDQGDPLYYIVDPEEARKTITVYPYPDAGDAGGTLVLTYYPLPASSTDDSAVPLNASLLMVQYHTGIAAYGAWLLMGAEVSTPEKVRKRADLIALYDSKVTDAINTFGNTISERKQMRGGRYWSKGS